MNKNQITETSYISGYCSTKKVLKDCKLFQRIRNFAVQEMLVQQFKLKHYNYAF